MTTTALLFAALLAVTPGENNALYPNAENTPGSGAATGDIDLVGHKLTIDLDKDSYYYASADDVHDWYSSGGLEMQLAVGGLAVKSAGYFRWIDRTIVTSPADSKLLLTNSAGTDFNLMQFGCVANTCPALKRVTTGLEVKLADDSAHTTLKASELSVPGVGRVSWGSRSEIYSSADGLINLTNDAATGFTALTLGPETTSGIRLKLNGNVLNIREGDDSADIALTAAAIDASSTITSTASVRAGAAFNIGFTGRSRLFSSADGLLNVANAAGTGLTGLTLGPETTDGIRLKLNGNVLNIREGDDSADISISAADITTTDAKGALTTFEQPVYEDLTCAGGGGSANLTTAGTAIPDGAFLIGVTTRVITALNGPTDIDVGFSGGDTDAFADGAAEVDAGDTTDNTHASAAWANPQLADTEIVVTFNGGNCVNGVIRVYTHYLTVTAATSS